MDKQSILNLDRNNIASIETLDDLYSTTQNTLEREELKNALIARAKDLGQKIPLEKLIKVYEKELKKQNKENEQYTIAETNFGDVSDEFFLTKSWTADALGIRQDTIFGVAVGCYDPIFPDRIIKNIETGKEKIVLKYKKGKHWKEITVDKGDIATASKIVKLADFGVNVTSESAKTLVRYFSEFEHMNRIPIEMAVSKLGWNGDDFLPYDMETKFDAAESFKSLFESIPVDGVGKREEWMKTVLDIRKSGRYETRLYMAGAFASVLVSKLKMLPFILNLWGDTGKGKTVALMVATSIFANPAEGKYMTDPISTQAALEARNDVLNHLPMVIDDFSKTRDRNGNDFTDLVYYLCGGKGKDRSNTSLGLNCGKTWQNCTLTNIERPLATETMRGGAINRILDFEMEDGSIFENGNQVVKCVKENYGFVGREFIEIIQNTGIENVEEIQKDFLLKIIDIAKEKGCQKEEKQIMPMSLVLVADKIATDCIFKDGIYLDVEKCVDALKDVDAVSEHRRAYEFISSTIASKKRFFELDPDHPQEMWGKIDGDYAVIVRTKFDEIAKAGEFSPTAFLNWAKRKNLIVCGKNDTPTKSTRINGIVTKCVFLKLPDEPDETNETSKKNNENWDDISLEELPFS